MDYLIFGRFFKSEKKLEPKPSKLPNKGALYIWRSENKSVLTEFVKSELAKKWEQLADIPKTPETNEKRYSLTMLLNKLIDALNILNINENPDKTVDLVSTLLEKIPSTELIRRFYCFVLSQCFFAKEEQYQGAYIRELFKNLTKKSITSEHFRVLAVLVSKYGI